MKELNQEQYRFLDITLKVIGGIFIIISTYIGISQFTITKEREFLIILYQDDIHTLNDIISATSQMASYPKNSNKFKEADSTFDELRAGKVLYLNDKDLHQKVTDFYVAKEKYKSGSADITKERLLKLSFDLANYSRLKIEETMKLN